MGEFEIKAIQNHTTVRLITPRPENNIFGCVNLHVLFSSQSLYASGGGLKDTSVDKHF